jgi:hypothetical protein
MDDTDHRETSWDAHDYLTSLDRFFEIEAMEEWTSEERSDSFVLEWNLRRAA